MMHRSVLLDTSFFLRFLNSGDPLSSNADDYFRYFIDTGITMVISTVSIAEYCVGGGLDELPLRNLKIIPFNLNHSIKTGALAKIAFDAKRKGVMGQLPRAIIPNDTKLFAQADCDENITFYLSSDVESQKVYNTIHQSYPLAFRFLNLNDKFDEDIFAG